jgi:3-dehydroquinate synthase
VTTHAARPWRAQIPGPSPEPSDALEPGEFVEEFVQVFDGVREFDDEPTEQRSEQDEHEEHDQQHWRVSAYKHVTYDVTLCADVLDPADARLATAGSPTDSPAGRRLVVVDAQVNELYGTRIREYFRQRGTVFELCVIDAHEGAKSMDSVLTVVSAMADFGVPRRREPVIAIGGGVLTDLVGLATSLYRRSTPYVRVPTTLIGMIDAGIGAKTGVNFLTHKNRLGSYHPAVATLIDPSFLSTLTERQLRNGLAEILKIALVKDVKLFDLLEEHGSRLVAGRLLPEEPSGVGREVIRRAIRGMLQELEPNLWEHQLRRVVDYGHSFSPTIEMRALPELLHGESVCIDMALTSVIARDRGLLSDEELDRVLGVMRELGLPITHPVCTLELLVGALADTVLHRDGRQLLPLTPGIGKACFVDDLRDSEIEQALRTVRAWADVVPAADSRG